MRHIKLRMEVALDHLLPYNANAISSYRVLPVNSEHFTINIPV